MLEYKQEVAKFVLVRIFDQGGTPVSGVAFGSVTAAVQKADGSVSTLTVLLADWSEITTGAFSGTGMYLLKIPAGAFDQPGLFTYAVATTSNNTYIGAIKVVANEEEDTFAAVNLLKKYEEGRWKIHATGGDVNRLVLYDTDNTTPLLKFDLKDSAGAATVNDPFERVPVP